MLIRVILIPVLAAILIGCAAHMPPPMSPDDPANPRATETPLPMASSTLANENVPVAPAPAGDMKSMDMNPDMSMPGMDMKHDTSMPGMTHMATTGRAQ